MAGGSFELNHLPQFPGGSRGLEEAVSSGVVRLFGVSTNFAALKEDDSVVIWGSQETERWIPGQPDNPIVDIFTTGNAFTALRSDGSIEVLWRRVSFDGEYLATDHLQSINAQLQSGVVSLKALPNRADMAALKDDGSVVSWTWTQRFPDPHKNAALGQDVAAELAG
ncbi:MAG: hypothetical protein P5693_25980, partial [Limnospira sp. PMC 1290.21]|uniref:hypothetical protein n=1 Tax=Limnospira sp. PMC 1290.21 TaxID=2981073 RepID=UPI0028E1090D